MVSLRVPLFGKEGLGEISGVGHGGLVFLFGGSPGQVSDVTLQHAIEDQGSRFARDSN
jgi:hypothetical protein